MSAPPLIDTHCHFDAEDFDHDRLEVAARAQAAGVDAIVIPGYLAALWPRLFDVCASIRAPRLLPAPGLHPCYIAAHRQEDIARLEELLATRDDIVAVGEIGLDHYVDALREPEIRRRQVHFFQAQLELAVHHAKPVILHVRKAHQDVIRMLKHMKFREGGIVHSYSGSVEEARHYAGLGFRLGIGGPVTYDQSKRLRAVVHDMPLEALVLETDAPDMIPRPFRGPGPGRTRNSPEFLPSVAEAVAALKGLPLQQVLVSTRTQSLAVLRLPS